MTKQSKFTHCPHCGGVATHDIGYIGYPCDQRAKIHICQHCNWIWCKLWGKWYMARSFAELENPGGIEFEAERYLKGRLEHAKN